MKKLILLFSISLVFLNSCNSNKIEPFEENNTQDTLQSTYIKKIPTSIAHYPNGIISLDTKELIISGYSVGNTHNKLFTYFLSDEESPTSNNGFNYYDESLSNFDLDGGFISKSQNQIGFLGNGTRIDDNLAINDIYFGTINSIGEPETIQPNFYSQNFSAKSMYQSSSGGWIISGIIPQQQFSISEFGLLKLNANGNIVNGFPKTISYPNHSISNTSVLELQNNEILLFCESYDNVNFSTRMLVYRFDEMGNIITGFPKEINQLSGNDFIKQAITSTEDIIVLFNNTAYGYTIVRININGDIEKTEVFEYNEINNATEVYAKDIIIDKDENIVITGIFLTNQQKIKPFLNKINSEFEQLPNLPMEYELGDDYAYAYNITQAQDEGYILTGHFGWPNMGITIIKTDSNGKVE